MPDIFQPSFPAAGGQPGMQPNDYARMARMMMPAQMGGGGGMPPTQGQPGGMAPPMGGMTQPTAQQAAFPSAQDQQQQNFARVYQALNSPYNYQPEGL